MSSVSLKTWLSDDSAPVVENDAKMRKDNDQLLREPEPFYFIDDVTLEFRSLEEHLALGKVDAFRQLLKRLDKSDTLVRKKQNEAAEPVEPVTFHRTSPRMYGDQWSVSEESFVSDDECSSSDENSTIVLDTVDSPRPQEPLQQSIFFSQTSEQSVKMGEHEGQLIEGKGLLENLLDGDNGFLSSSAAVTEEPPEFSNQPKNVAQTSLHSELVKKLPQPRKTTGLVWSSNQVKNPIFFQNAKTHTKRDMQHWITGGFNANMMGHNFEVQLSTFPTTAEKLAELNFGGRLLDGDGNGLLSSSAAVTKEPPKFSNQPKNVAQTSLHSELVKKLPQPRKTTGLVESSNQVQNPTFFHTHMMIPMQYWMGRHFETHLRVFSAHTDHVFPADFDHVFSNTEKITELSFGGMILLPHSVLEPLLRTNPQFPLIFKVTNSSFSIPRIPRSTHCGVLEFAAPEGRCILPNWMMSQLDLSEGALVRIESATLPMATSVKLKPLSPDFLNLENPYVVSMNQLNKFACLTLNDKIAVQCNGQVLEFLVQDLQPADVVCVSDLNLEIVKPDGFH